MRVMNYYGNDRCQIVTLEQNRDIFKIEFPDADFMTFSRNDFFGYREFPMLHVIKKLREERYEKIFDLTGGTKAAFILLFSSSNQIFGANVRFYRKVYNHFLPLDYNRHVRELYPPIIDLDSEIPGFKSAMLKGENYKIVNNILIHPGAAWKSKEWGVRKYFELGCRLKALNYNISLIAESGSFSEEIQLEFRGAGIDVIYSKTLDDLKNQIGNCDLFIGNDSGPLHLANHLGKPTFAIYGPTNPEYHNPYYGINGYVRSIISCSPMTTKLCYLEGGRKCYHYECMNSLTVEMVYTELVKFMNEKLQPLKQVESAG